MVKVLLVVPYWELQETFEKSVARHDTRNLEIDIYHLYGSRNFQLDMKDYKIVAARGLTGRTIQERFPQLSFVEITVTSDDIINALDQCVESFGRQRIALVLADSITCSISSIRRLTGLDIEVFYIHGEEDADPVIQELQQKGINCVVGGVTVCRRCQELGIPAVSILTGAEAAERTIHVAIEMAKGIAREQMQNHLLRTLLDYHHDAVLACDAQGVIVEANVQAGYLLAQGTATVGDLVGLPIDQVLPDSDWRKVIRDCVATETIREFSEKMTVMRCTPMLIEGREGGVLFTIQNAEMIRASDTKLQRQVRRSGFTAKYTFQDILSQDPEMKRRLAFAYKFAKTDANVLIMGETGTGKELFAQSIHNASSRSGYPFVAVNCAALPAQLLESELFGYSEGAFSGAQKGGKVGLFELAHKGAVFLDEIGEMPISLQAKLLRFLQEKQIRRIGDSKVIPVDVRVISATNVSIHEKMDAGEFRRDLYYRINLLELRLPPLRERTEDMEFIFRRFLEQFSRELGQPVPVVTPEASLLMRQHPWYGNVRELRNFSERLVILNEGAPITPNQLAMAGLFEDYAAGGAPERTAALPRMRKEDMARELGISRTTLWRRSKKEGLN